MVLYRTIIVAGDSPAGGTACMGISLKQGAIAGGAIGAVAAPSVTGSINKMQE